MEKWDILSRSGKPTGRTVSRKNPILRRGEYHLVVHIWTVDAEGNILIQRRSDQKPLMPGEWAATGGAAIAGETSRGAACRELYEELSIKREKRDLEFVSRIVRRNSFVDVYITKIERDISGLTLQPDEVAEVKWATPSELAKMIEEADFHNYGELYFSKLFAAIEKNHSKGNEKENESENEILPVLSSNIL